VKSVVAELTSLDATQLTALGALAATLVAAYLNFRKAPSERQGLAVDTMDKVVVRMQSELDRAYRRIDQQDQELAEFRETVARLTTRIATLERSST